VTPLSLDRLIEYLDKAGAGPQGVISGALPSARSTNALISKPLGIRDTHKMTWALQHGGYKRWIRR